MEVNSDKYKMSEVGLIPSDWVEKNFSDICWVNQGLQIPISRRLTSPSKSSKIYITIQYLNEGKTTEYIDDYVPSVCCSKEDVLMTRTGNTGIVVSGVEGVFHNNFFKINFNSEKIDKIYVIYYLNRSDTKKIILAKAGTSTIPDLNHKDFYSIPIPLPPTKAEQTAIATALTDADALISSLEKLIEKKRNIKQGAMQKLLQPKEGWVVKKLGEIANIVRGASPRPIEDPKWFDQNSQIGWVRISDVTKSVKILTETTQKLSELGIQSSRYVEEGNLIMSICATVGRPILTRINVCIHDGFVVFRNPQVEIDYLYYFLSFIEKDWSKNGQTGSQMNLNTTLINTTEIPIPPTKVEQTRIAIILSDMDAEIAALETKLEKYRNIKLGMMQNLLTGKIRLV